MAQRVIIIGGGIIGLATAWFCRQRGYEVAVVDRGPSQRDGCSFGNAGMVVPSHFIPLAAPGMVATGLKMMWNPRSPFYFRPRLAPELWNWAWKFLRACNANHVEKTVPVLRDLGLASRRLYSEWHAEFQQAFDLQERGLIMLCHTERGLEKEAEIARLANEQGIEARILGQQETSQLDPGVQLDVVGGVYFPGDCHLSPQKLMSVLERRLDESGCEFHWRSEVVGFESGQKRIRGVKLATANGNQRMEADWVVVCGGAWSGRIGKGLGLQIPMQAGKGYSLTLSQPRQLPKICSILTEAKVAVTPLNGALRFGGTMEITGLDESISQPRLDGIIESACRYFPAFETTDFQGIEPWVGLRPLSADGLPIIGIPTRWENLVMNTGHAMMGVSLAPISGQIVTDLIAGRQQKVLEGGLLSPDRF